MRQTSDQIQLRDQRFGLQGNLDATAVCTSSSSMSSYGWPSQPSTAVPDLESSPVNLVVTCSHRLSDKANSDKDTCPPAPAAQQSMMPGMNVNTHVLIQQSPDSSSDSLHSSYKYHGNEVCPAIPMHMATQVAARTHQAHDHQLGASSAGVYCSSSTSKSLNWPPQHLPEGQKSVLHQQHPHHQHTQQGAGRALNSQCRATSGGSSIIIPGLPIFPHERAPACSLSLPPRPAASHHPKQGLLQLRRQPSSGLASQLSNSATTWHASHSSTVSGLPAIAAVAAPMAAGAVSIGRYAAPMECSPVAESQASDSAACSDPCLECNEELLSIDPPGLCPYQIPVAFQLQSYPASRCNTAQCGTGRIGAAAAWPTPGIPAGEMAAATGDVLLPGSDADSCDESDSTAAEHCSMQDVDMRRDQDGSLAAAAAAAGHPAGRQDGVWQVLSKAAALRRAGAASAAPSAACPAAGYASSKRRLLIAEVSVYPDAAATSTLALEQANRLLARMTLPDGVTYMPVSADSYLFRVAAAWQFPAFAICLGSSYLQRMMEKLPQLAHATLSCPGFEDYSAFLNNRPMFKAARPVGNDAVALLSMLRSVQFTCLFLATKLCDQVHAIGLLRFVLTHLSVDRNPVSLEAAVDVEARCLEALGWRLGPFFLEDELPDQDEQLWAAAMGRWEYGG